MTGAKRLVALALVSVMFFEGCSKKDNPVEPIIPVNSESEVIINGGGFNNTKIKSNVGLGVFDHEDHFTYVSFTSVENTDSIVVTLVFAGQGAGTYTWNPDSSGAYIWMGGTNQRLFLSNAEGTTLVTKYGSVNDKVIGTFSGKLYDYTSSDSITVTGSFSVVRTPDAND